MSEAEDMISPGDVPWFPAEQFDGYLWRYSDAVYLSLIISLKPGCGNLSRLFDAIWKTGRAVKVPTPFAHMQAILRAKGFQETSEGACEVWVKPPASV